MELGFLAVGVAGAALLIRHGRKAVELLSGSWLGKGQLLYLVLLWGIYAASTAHEAATPASRSRRGAF